MSSVRIVEYPQKEFNIITVSSECVQQWTICKRFVVGASILIKGKKDEMGERCSVHGKCCIPFGVC
jgi:hypothetical protein